MSEYVSLFFAVLSITLTLLALLASGALALEAVDAGDWRYLAASAVALVVFSALICLDVFLVRHA